VHAPVVVVWYTAPSMRLRAGCHAVVAVRLGG
jgi:hypothetical protein